MYTRINPLNTQSDTTITGILKIFNLFENKTKKQKITTLKQLNNATPHIQWLNSSYVMDIYKTDYEQLQPLDYFESGSFNNLKIRYIPLSMFNYTTTQNLKRFYDTNNFPIEIEKESFDGLDFKILSTENDLSVSCAFEVDGALRLTQDGEDDIRFGLTNFLRLNKTDIPSNGLTYYYNFPNEENRVGKPKTFIGDVLAHIEQGYEVIIGFSSIAFIEKAMYEFRVSTLRPILEHYITSKETSALMFKLGHMIQDVDIFEVLKYQLKENVPNTFNIAKNLIQAYTNPSILNKIEQEHSKYYQGFYVINVINSIMNLYDRVSSINLSIIFDNYIDLHDLILERCSSNSIIPEFQDIIIKNNLGLKLTELLHRVEQNEQFEYIDYPMLKESKLKQKGDVLGIKSSQLLSSQQNQSHTTPYSFIMGVFNEIYDATFPNQSKYANASLEMQLQFIDYEAEIFEGLDKDVLQFVVQNLKQQISLVDDSTSEHNALLSLTRLAIQHLECIVKIFEHIGGNSYEIKPVIIFVMMQSGQHDSQIKIPSNYQSVKHIICGSAKYTMQEYLLVVALTLFTNSTLCIVNEDENSDGKKLLL